MKPAGRAALRRPLPLAMAAVTVAGQCRERSPADLAVFGAGAARFADRFVDRAVGEAMLAEAVSEGVAEREAQLHTGSGDARFRIALWRQRGGERIRLLSSFASLQERSSVPSAGRAVPARRVTGFGEQVRLPFAAIMALAQKLRRGDCAGGEYAPGELAGDILAASWRMLRLVDDLVLLADLGADTPPLRMSEVDVARLTRRVLRLAEPMAAAAGVTLTHDLGNASGPSVLADETTLWSVIENLVRAAVESSAPGGEVAITCRPDAGDLVLCVAAKGSGGGPPGQRLALGLTEEMSTANGARLHFSTEGGFAARLAFPKERCLNPI